MRLVFPTAMIVMSLAAAVLYIPSGQWSKVLYWTAAAVLNTAVTYGHLIDRSKP